MSDSGRSGFLSRWSQRKIQARENRQPHDDGQAAERPVMPADGEPAVVQTRPPGDPLGAAPVPDVAVGHAQAPGSDPVAARPGLVREKPLPSLDDVELLTPESDFSSFVARGVAPAVKNAAMKKLFSDPHFNVMDGLDIYIDDYTQREILPESMMRKMASSKFLRMFDDEEEAQASVAAQQATHPGHDAEEQADAHQPDFPQTGAENSVPVATDMVSSPDEARIGVPELSKAGTPAAAALGVSPGLPTAVTPVQNRPEASRTSMTKSENQPGDAPSDTKPLERSN